MELVLNGYAFQHICKFLDPIDIINMCHIYPYQWTKLYYVFKTSIIRKIDNFFKEYFDHQYAEFRKEMIKNRAILSGSFILQMILGEKWEDSDIDIYIPIKGLNLKTTESGNPKTELEDFLYFTTYHACSNFQSGYETGPATQIKYIREYTKMDPELIIKFDGQDINNTDYLHERRMVDMRTIQKCNLRFQTILIDNDPDFNSMKKYIYHNFDLDICKNVFYYDTNGTCQLALSKASYIIDKKINFNFHPTVTIPLLRYTKYVDRGFTFIEGKKTVFDMVINNSLICINYEKKEYVKRYMVFEVKLIGKIKRIDNCFCSDGAYSDGYYANFEIIKNVSGDELPHHQCKKKIGTYSNGSQFSVCFNYHTLAILYNDRKCEDSVCPINLCLGKEINHFHLHKICHWCGFPDGYYADYIFIYP